jgi:hypothetical protein
MEDASYGWYGWFGKYPIHAYMIPHSNIATP